MGPTSKGVDKGKRN